jgi:signal transduction histidine kinase
MLAAQQSALRRVATLVAHGEDQSEVFSAVADEMARCLNMNNAEVLRYADDGAAVVVASYAAPGEPSFPIGERVTLEGDNVAAMVRRTGCAAHKDNYEHATGSLAARAREMGIRSAVGAPIVVDERLWGVALVRSRRPEPLPPETEEHIAEFADLAATAIAAATTRAELIKSRGRIVAAADQTRRRLERNLHDGAQQRAVSLGLRLRIAQDLVPPELGELNEQLSRIQSGLNGLSEELREISHGLHPAILSRGGLGPAIETLARRATIPVTLDVEKHPRLAESVEVAAYYVVAEAFTNAAKHAQASQLTVTLNVDDENLHVLVRDDGVGGADSNNGSGLIGLTDRVEALGGQLDISSPAGNGTTLRATIPLHRP